MLGWLRALTDDGLLRGELQTSMQVLDCPLLPIEISGGIAPHHLPRFVQRGAHMSTRAWRSQVAAYFAHGREGFRNAHVEQRVGIAPGAFGGWTRLNRR